MKHIKLFEGFLNENASEIKGAKEIKEERYDEMHEVLPPIYVNSIDGTKVKGFAVSEPFSNKGELPTFDVFFEDGGKYYELANACTLKKDSGKDITFDDYNDQEWSKDNQATTI